MINGKLFIISAPSGTGKSSLIQALLKQVSLTQVSISHTTRKIRPGEYNGKHYFFISEKKFKMMIQEKQFLEYAIVFNNYYGTSKAIIKQMLSHGSDVFLTIDWQGAQNIRKKIPNVKSIFIFPPSISELYRRLITRGQDTNLVIKYRMKAAIMEMSHYLEYDYLIINDKFHTALSDLISIIHAERLRIEKHNKRYFSMMNRLYIDNIEI
ncbi:MAG TPA: guanylate kinase [Buchnera sp. (in: enterobacteria)]|nr:guanylate kinase [Buchnera sp. (in: enterobacteria)]